MFRHLMRFPGFPKLYFQDPKTKLFEAVPNGGTHSLVANLACPCSIPIGLLVYYQNRGDGDVSNGGPGLKV
jgi:hypothetical protein